jgi:hypothetical protein
VTRESEWLTNFLTGETIFVGRLIG